MEEFAVGFGLSQIVLSVLLLWSTRHKSKLARFYNILAISLAAYFLELLPLPDALDLVMQTLSSLWMGVFWVFCSLLFLERYEKWQLYVALLPPLLFLLAELAELRALQRLIPVLALGYLVATVWIVIANWRDDLVPARRIFRMGITIFACSLSLASVVSDAWLRVPEWFYLDTYFLVCLFLVLINVAVLRWNTEAMLIITRAAKPIADDETAGELKEAQAPREEFTREVQELAQLMDEGIYREHGLTIGELAKRMRMPEYRLRQLINQQLGFRNFTEYLNGYRLKEAASRLSDPKERNLPVLTIALDAGFRSLSPFNKAFKECYGMTPTVYRKENM